MRKGPLIVMLAVLCVAAVPVIAYLAKPREVITSTPSDYTGLTVPLRVPAGSELCDDQIVFDTDSRIARFGVSAAPGTTAPALDIVARGATSGAYRNDYRSTFHLPGGWRGTRELNMPLRPPHTAVFGDLCIRNLGDDPVDLVGAQDGRAFSRPTVSLDGHTQPTELQLRLLESGKHSILSRLGAVTTHAATAKPLGAWWMWVLALALIVLAPLGVLASVRAALATDGES
jgi:hypothetical protein